MRHPKPVILSIATQNPPHHHQQMHLHDRWLHSLIRSHRARAIFAAAEIDTRCSIFADDDFLSNQPTTRTRNALFLEVTPPLAEQAIRTALEQADLSPTAIDHFIFVTCTGIDTPGVEVGLAAALGMRPTMRRSALVGMGCQAGLTAVDRAMLELTARPTGHVLIVAAELCTPQFQEGASLENMIAAAIFGDGIAAAIIGVRAPTEAIQPRIIDTMSYHDYGSQGLMGVHLSDTGFQIELSSKVPKRLKPIIPQVVGDFLRQVNLPQTAIRFWGIHPGGAQIINTVGDTLGLTETDLRFARQVLRRYGNMSSATIFFVLQAIIEQGDPQSGDYALLLTFGPGLTVELGLLQF